MKFRKINYEDLNPKQKEKFNYQKVSALLADYGFITIPLSDDWNGADFLAVHKDGEILKIQLKGRMTFDKKYLGKDLHICFRDGEQRFVYPHDTMFEKIESEMKLTLTDSWKSEGKYSFPKLSERQKIHLGPCQLNQSLGAAA